MNKKAHCDEDDEYFKDKHPNRHTPGVYLNTPIGNLHEFYLSGEITGPEDYYDWFHIIRNATENDQVILHINSPGGYLSTAIQMISAIKDSSATITASVEGECASAATIVFFAADIWASSPHSLFMFHNYSGGVIGKGNEMYQQILGEKVWIEKVFRDSYEGILSEEELDEMMSGRDFWLPADDVIDRLKAKIERQEADANPVKRKPAAKAKPKTRKKAI